MNLTLSLEAIRTWESAGEPVFHIQLSPHCSSPGTELGICLRQVRQNQLVSQPASSATATNPATPHRLGGGAGAPAFWLGESPSDLCDPSNGPAEPHARSLRGLNPTSPSPRLREDRLRILALFELPAAGFPGTAVTRLLERVSRWAQASVSNIRRRFSLLPDSPAPSPARHPEIRPGTRLGPSAPAGVSAAGSQNTRPGFGLLWGQDREVEPRLMRPSDAPFQKSDLTAVKAVLPQAEVAYERSRLRRRDRAGRIP
jgi:hypothetical protein